MVQDCPSCGLVNPPSAQRCDCGYDFTRRRVDRSFLNAKDQSRLAEHDPAQAAPAFCCTVIGNAVGILLDDRPGIHLLAFVGTTIAADMALRLFVLQCSVIDVERGSRVLFAPAWVFALVVGLFGGFYLLAIQP